MIEDDLIRKEKKEKKEIPELFDVSLTSMRNRSAFLI